MYETLFRLSIDEPARYFNVTRYTALNKKVTGTPLKIAREDHETRFDQTFSSDGSIVQIYALINANAPKTTTNKCTSFKRFFL